MKRQKIFIYCDGDFEDSYITHWHRTEQTRPITTIVFPDNYPCKNLDMDDLRSDGYSEFLKTLDLLEL